MKAILILLSLVCLNFAVRAQELLFEDDFRSSLGPGWSWIREHAQAWRLTDRGLEVRVERGNMWGPQNNAGNLLVRPAPNPTNSEVEVAVTVENQPTSQYEQVDLVWYYDDSHMVKLGQELVDGKLSVVMGREENDRCRTVAIIPLASTKVRLKLFAKESQIRGQFRIPNGTEWQDVGKCSIPAVTNATPKISLQFYQGPQDAEHWARVTEFRVLKHK